MAGSPHLEREPGQDQVIASGLADLRDERLVVPRVDRRPVVDVQVAERRPQLRDGGSTHAVACRRRRDDGQTQHRRGLGQSHDLVLELANVKIPDAGEQADLMVDEEYRGVVPGQPGTRLHSRICPRSSRTQMAMCESGQRHELVAAGRSRIRRSMSLSPSRQRTRPDRLQPSAARGTPGRPGGGGVNSESVEQR